MVLKRVYHEPLGMSCKIKYLTILSLILFSIQNINRYMLAIVSCRCRGRHSNTKVVVCVSASAILADLKIKIYISTNTIQSTLFNAWHHGATPHTRLFLRLDDSASAFWRIRIHAYIRSGWDNLIGIGCAHGTQKAQSAIIRRNTAGA